MEFWKIISKVIDTLTVIVVILILLGIVLSSNVRSNFSALGETLVSSGPIGILIIIFWLWVFRKTPSKIQKLFKAKGFNAKFWNDL